ncbi:5'/3'-nucleotidase SurE [Psychrobacter sp. 1U2]|uniref:5'/3'-nucleotidase SurE n=1 Tax=Psychrobacter sp. 1U2 TaxID=3453577 RepID=UPI003F46D72B
MKFLISNDDGVHAPGLLALYRALSAIGEVHVVAPDTEQSGSASALRISQPLYTQNTALGFIAVNGTPADCVYLALHELYCDVSFDCVITGINSGANLGQDVLFSGTFGAALTAQIFGVPAIATSLAGGASKANRGSLDDEASHYTIAAAEIVKLITETDILTALKELPYHVLNVNIPEVKNASDIQGRKLTCLTHSQIAKPVHHIVDPRGRDAYWLCLRKSTHSPLETASSETTPKTEASLARSTAVNQRHNNHDITSHVTDAQALADRFVSLSPVRLHHTPLTSLERLSALAL